MAIPVVDSVSNLSGNGVGPFTWAHTCAGSDRLLRVTVSHYDSSDPVTGITYNGVALTAVPSGATTNGQYWITAYYLIAPDVGTYNIVVTVSGNVFDFGAGAISYNDVHQTVPFGTAVTATGTDTTPTVTVSSAADELVDDGLVIVHGGTLSVGAGQTQRWNAIATFGFIKYAGSTEVGAASTTMSWSNSSSQTWAIVAVPIKPTVGAPATSIVPHQAYYRRRRAA